jgi:PhnB protein
MFAKLAKELNQASESGYKLNLFVANIRTINFNCMALSKTKNSPSPTSIPTTIAPWLSVRNSQKAVDFYKAAFSATEAYRLDAGDGGLVAKLSVEGAEFWISDESPGSLSPESLGGSSVRMILTVNDPDAFFLRALKAGASEVFPVAEEHGWRVGRLVDPYGHHWEICRPVSK